MMSHLRRAAARAETAGCLAVRSEVGLRALAPRCRLATSGLGLALSSEQLPAVVSWLAETGMNRSEFDQEHPWRCVP